MVRYCLSKKRYVSFKKGGNDMDFKDFLIQNKDKIRRLSDSNTVKNSKGEVVITLDDPWRNETIWDDNDEYKLGEVRA